MHEQDWDAVLDAVDRPIRDYLASLPERPVARAATPGDVRGALDAQLTAAGQDPAAVVADLAARIEPHVTTHAAGRFFGFVVGGLHPAALGAELLVSTWDQNAGLFALAPGVVIAEELAAEWLVELTGLPPTSSVAFVTGGQMATFTCLAAARDHVLRETGWDVEADGLQGAPTVTAVLKRGVHSSVPRALRYLGLGHDTGVRVACDDQDRIDVEALRAALAEVRGPTIVCVEAGNVNTGAFDDFEGVAEAAAAHRQRGNPTWVHVDGAVGLLAAASPAFDHLTTGLGRLDSWSTDGHKLLNTAYDCGVAICRDSAAHRAATSVQASYLRQDEDDVRQPLDWNPEFSRRARGVGAYATMRSLGRDGVAALSDQLHARATQFAGALAASGRAEIVNDVVFNQVLVRWLPPDGVDADAYNDAITDATVADGRTYFSGTTWRGARMMRISVSDHATDEADVDLAVAVLLELADRAAEDLRW